jgi:hypothetical protein
MDSFNPAGVYNLPPCSDGSCSAGFTGGATGMIPGTTSGTLAGTAGSTMMKPMTGTAGGMVTNRFPTIEDIASYNYLSPQQQQQQRQQLVQSGSTQFAGNPRTMTQSTAATNILAPISPNTQPMPMTAESLQYMNGFLRTQIGRPVKVDFLIGTNTLVDRTGILLGVGVNYILINEIETDDVVACDFYNIKFIKFFY